MLLALVIKNVFTVVGMGQNTYVLCHHHGLATKGQQRQAPTLVPSGTLEIARDYLLFTMFIRFSPKIQVFTNLFQGFFT